MYKNIFVIIKQNERHSISRLRSYNMTHTKTKENNNISGNLPLLLCIVFNELSYFFMNEQEMVCVGVGVTSCHNNGTY